MNKKVVAVIVVLLIVVGLYGAYRVYKHFTRVASSPAMMQTTASGSTQSGTGMSSLKDLISKGIAQSCTYSTDKSQGTIYMSGGKVRADIDTMVGSVSTKAHMIMMDNTSYIWTDSMSTGFKMSYDPNATPVPGASPSTAQQTIDANASMNYNCSAWLTDSSKFTLPSNVKFGTFGMPSAPQQAPGAAGGSSSQCSYCSSLSGDAKAQCLAALNCN